ncbi:isoprenylcysteine carboxylmethyltransferase family protein [Rhodovulum sp. FJ3]|uniref:methyltransferase family protein n=1 Tax=Rhodovulum sp. FJ3 TaxID=3079053 RepID=UPI00293DFEFA|nr:isoprenylcysteine carboxylmethyltransferase family protein [Rhodovulum sp. FJ3]MDV4169481.1 isoprenylcysteine carboxylmethyltransferase family protein [Rhodovulum sp. FJ3]
MQNQSVKPVRQYRRILVLRLTMAFMIPLILFSRSAWMDPEWVFDIFEVIGIFAIIAGVLGRFWAVLYIGGRKNNMVMQDGPYSVCRHPLYLFSTIATVGFGLMLGSLIVTAILGGVIFMILSITASKEERFLRAEFGAQYDEYAARVPRILPKPSLFATEPRVEFNVTSLRVNLADALVFLSLIPLAELSESLKEAAFWPTFPLF